MVAEGRDYAGQGVLVHLEERGRVESSQDDRVGAAEGLGDE